MTFPSHSRIAGLATAILSLVLLAGCEDPSGVGLNVVDFGETDPHTSTVPAEVSYDSLRALTGFHRPPGAEAAGRFLAGSAHDPLVGSIEAIGHIDFRMDILPSEFFVAEIIEVFLELPIDYRFGDSASSAVIDVLQIDEAWDGRDFDASTEVSTTSPRQAITTFSATSADTLMQVSLPEDWVAANDTLLRAFNMEEVFHGFQLRPTRSSGLVLGFTPGSSLKIVWDTGVEAEPDTAVYRSRNVATGGRLTPLESPPHEALLPLQDNSGLGLMLDIRLDTLEARAISAGVIRIEADTLLAASFRPRTFLSPRVESLILYGLSDSGPVFIAEGRLDEQREAYIFQSPALNIVLREIAFDRSRFDGLAVGFPPIPRTVNVAPLVSTPDAPPRAIVIVTPLDP